MEEQERELLASDVNSEEEAPPLFQQYQKKKLDRFLGCCHPSRYGFRYLILLLLCVVKMGMVYSIDLPAALERTIINVMRVDITQYELLYSLYSWPSVVLVLIGGVLIDRVFGLRLGLLLFVTIACIGQLLVAMGGYFNQFWLMVFGRFVFGAGTELASTTVDIFAAALFRERELSFVFGIVYGADRITSTVNLNLSGRLHAALGFIADRNARLGSVMLLGFLLCLMSIAVTFVAIHLDYKREKVIGKKREKRGQFRLKDIKDFSLSFWLISIVGLLFYVPVFPFISIAQVFFEQKYGYNTDMANLVNSMIYFIPAGAFPVFGLVFDLTGYKLFWGMFTITGTLTCHLVFAFTGLEYYIPIITTLSLGLFYSMFTSAVWPQVFLLIQEHQLGTAYGITYSIYQLGQALAPIIVGQILDNSGYMVLELFFAGILSLTLLLIVTLYISSGGQKLNLSGRITKIFMAKQNTQIHKETVLPQIRAVDEIEISQLAIDRRSSLDTCSHTEM